MLVLTVQKKMIWEKMMEGEYKGSFLLSEYSFLSKNFRKAYLKMQQEINEKNKKIVLEEGDSPVWAWAQKPFLGFHKWKDKGNLKAIFLDIPKEEMVFSSYDKYCEYVDEETDSENYMVDEEYVLSHKKDCIQVCIGRVKPENIVLVVDYAMIKDNETDTVNTLYSKLKWNTYQMYEPDDKFAA